MFSGLLLGSTVVQNVLQSGWVKPHTAQTEI